MTKQPDARMDKAISWVLMTFCGVSLSIGAWFFNSGVASLDKLQTSIGQLEKSVTTLTWRMEALEKQSADRWTAQDMKLWAAMLQAKNPALTVPEPD